MSNPSINEETVSIPSPHLCVKPNQLVRVSDDATHHAGRVGYFQFLGEGVSSNVAVLSTSPAPEESDTDPNDIPLGFEVTLFAVRADKITPVT